MEMDKQTQNFLNNLNSQNFPPLETFTPEQIRNFPPLFGYESKASIKSVGDVRIPVENGEIVLRIYTPNGQGPFPVFVTFHGGGWVTGSLNNHDGICRESRAQANYLVVSVDYRLAPENKFPKPLNDCYQATLWVENNIQSYNGDPQKIVVGGDSAGGNLAAAVALNAREENKPSIKAEVLIYPALDNNFETESYIKYANGFFQTKSSCKWFWSQYLKDKNDANNSYAAPLKAKSLDNLPPTLIIIAELDVLKDEALNYGKKLEEAGVKVKILKYPSIHGFVSFADRLDIGKKATEDIAEYLQNIFKK